MLKIDIRHIFLLDNIHSEMVFCAVDFVMRTCNTPHNGVYDCLSRVNEKSLFALNILFESLIMSLLVVGKRPRNQHSVRDGTKQLSGELLSLSQFLPHTAAQCRQRGWDSGEVVISPGGHRPPETRPHLLLTKTWATES